MNILADLIWFNPLVNEWTIKNITAITHVIVLNWKL